eukprot:SAG22_NODE_12546_length_438_cov_1.067847_1_plen_146_part_11
MMRVAGLVLSAAALAGAVPMAPESRSATMTHEVVVSDGVSASLFASMAAAVEAAAPELGDMAVTVAPSDDRRRLQAGGVPLVVTYSVNCGSGCAGVVASMVALDPTVHAQGLIDAINAVAPTSMGSVVLSSASDVAASIVMPTTVS